MTSDGPSSEEFHELPTVTADGAKAAQAILDRIGGYRVLRVLGDPIVNHLIAAVAEAERGNPVAAREHLSTADAFWPEKLKNPDGYLAYAEAGELWIESADDLIRLKDEAEAAIAVASGYQP